MSRDSSSFSEHLTTPQGRGRTPAGARTGAAGGAACGDLVRDLARARRRTARIADAGFDASGCGAAQAAGSAAVALIAGGALLDAARIGAGEIAAELGGLIPSKMHAAELAADALHRALGAAARQARLAPARGRVLVAMSGGVDSAVAALLVAGEGREAVACTLELWADAENDGELSCCSAQAVRSARALAHALGMPHLSIDLRAEFRAGVVEGWLEDHRSGLTPNPCIRCNGNVRLDAMLELAERPRRARRLATGHYARLEHRSGPEPLLMTAADVAKDQSYVLCGTRAGFARASALPARRAAEDARCARSRAAPAWRSRASATRRISASSPAPAASAFLARHGGMRRRPGRDPSPAAASCSASTRGAHLYTVGQRRGLGLARSRRRCTCSAPTPPPTPSPSAAAASC